MNLWLLTTEYPPFSGGGISTYCDHTAKMFAQGGHKVTIFMPDQSVSRITTKSIATGIRLVTFPLNMKKTRRFLGWDASLSYDFSVVLDDFQLREGQPDAIESQEYLGIAYYPLQRRLLEKKYLDKCTFFVTAHAPSFLYLDHNQAPCYQFPEFWTGEMERSVLLSADFILSPSQYLLNQIQERIDLSKCTTHVLRNPYEIISGDVAYTDGDLVFFGKLTPQKGGLQMLNALKEMWDEGFAAKLRLIGGDDHFFYPTLMDMGQYIHKHFGEYIKKGLLSMEGHIPPKNLRSRLINAHVVIVPSIVDNLPYTVLEAMSLGKIVLASEQGGHSELIQSGINGFTFSHVRQDFSNVLNKILTLSKAEVEGIGHLARETIKATCSYSTILEQKTELVRSLKKKREENEFPFVRPRKRTKSIKTIECEPSLLTIVIPFYNLGRYLKDCVKSVVASSYTNKQIIIVNDGSTDSYSLQVLSEVGQEFDVEIINQRNKGLCVTRNESSERASGEFLAFLDADDIIQPDFYEKAIKVLEAYKNISFVGCWAQYFGENDEIWPSFNPEPPYLLTHNMVNSSALVYRRAHFISSGGNDPRMIYGMEDYETILNMVMHGYHGVVIPEILWNYRIRKNSMAQSFNRYSELYLYRLISKKHKAYFSEYAEEVINILNANGPSINYNNPTKHLSSSGILSYIKEETIKFIKERKLLRKIARIFYRKLT